MYHIGQEVVAIKDGKFIKKDKTYIIKDVQKGCEHYPTILDIGVLSDGDSHISHCDICSFRISTGRVIWFSSKCFVPVDYTKAKKVTFEKITEQFPVIANCLLIFVFLCSFVIVRERKYTFAEKVYVYKKMERFLKPIIYSKKECTCELW